MKLAKESKRAPRPIKDATTRSGLVAKQLREYIVSGRLAPGQKLPSENELALSLGVSRSAIREGLEALDAVGAVTTCQGKGHFVSQCNTAIVMDSLAIVLRFDRQSLRDMLEVRKVLELESLSRAALLLAEDDFKALEEIIHRMRLRVKGLSTYIVEDMEFHSLLFRKLNNDVLLKILEAFWKLFGRVEEGTTHTLQQLTEGVSQHQAILTALRKGDKSRAEHLLRFHFRDADLRIAAGTGTNLVASGYGPVAEKAAKDPN